ncbi:putative carbamoyl-phosphate synthase arginine-specific large chain [Phytophthora infestans]|uniref:Putative carbamoyl-phosphate synthase arginine-specific large chain n=1 Tax=Phytophthora infestans TaxID=4787 RepID=A0A833TH72_PHYIN|nr:putative carbamoyl-phosphate synthase arginine-specific large chain [Phytophthora infestans]
MWCSHEHGLPRRHALGECQQRSSYVHIHGHDHPAFRSGGLLICQAGEFDYSSLQVIDAVVRKALTSYIATVQPSQVLVDNGHFVRARAEAMLEIITKE